MKASAKYIAVVFCLLLPAIARAQSVGQVECPRGDGYVYLYSSMTTLDVRTTLQCGEQVQITGRYDTYVGVRTAKGETGYVPISSLLFLKDKVGPKAPQKPPRQPARPRTAYDEPTAHAEAVPKAAPSASDLTLLNGTPIHLMLGKTISSASAHVGDVVELKVVEEVVVDGLSVIPRGATAIGIVTDAEPKKRLGRGGKLGLSINFVRLSDSEKAAVRSFQEGNGSNTSAGAALPLASGKDVAFAQGTEFTAYVDGDMHLKREAFQAAKDDAGAAPAPPAQNPSQPRGR
jgi:hypothetical protein